LLARYKSSFPNLHSVSVKYPLSLTFSPLFQIPVSYHNSPVPARFYLLRIPSSFVAWYPGFSSNGCLLSGAPFLVILYPIVLWDKSSYHRAKISTQFHKQSLIATQPLHLFAYFLWMFSCYYVELSSCDREYLFTKPKYCYLTKICWLLP
jgi:hypothetical protein